MGLILSMILFALEMIWNLIKLFGCAVWHVSKSIFKYFFLILKPVYKFLLKALPITTVLVSCGILFIAFGTIFSGFREKNEVKQQTNIQENNTTEENKGIFDIIFDKAILRMDNVGNIILSSFEKLENKEYTGSPIIGLIIVIVGLALLPVLTLILFIILVVSAFYEIPILGLALDIIRHVYIYIRYRPNPKDTLTGWVSYALSDFFQDENIDNPPQIYND